jgi:phosphatidylglycerophosphatase A
VRGIARFVSVAAASGFGTGYSPVAPGTAGSLAAAAVFALAIRTGPAAAWIGLAVLLPVSFAAGAAGVRMWGRDPARVTIDEWVGCWIACMAAPHSLLWLAAAFLLFRVFDILKPWPVSFFDRMEGSAGVVLDDIAAGLIAALALLAGRIAFGML